MADTINFDAVQAALKATKLLRRSVRDLFGTLSEGPAPAVVREISDGDETTPDQILLTEIQSIVNNINARIRDLESASTLLTLAPTGNISLGHSALLAQDPAWERTSLYSSLVSAYRWSERVHEHSTHVVQVLNANMLKRSANQVLGIGAVRARNLTTHPYRRPVYSPAEVDAFCEKLQRMFAENGPRMEILRPFGAPAVLKVTLDRVLQSVIVLRGASIERVLVRGFSEDMTCENGRLDIWTPSRYKVFQKITDHANAAMLHYVHCVHPELAVKSYIVSNITIVRR